MVVHFLLPDVLGGVSVDFFKFLSPESPTKLAQGQIINGLKSKMWIERYREAGEFKFVANAESGLREFLPEGSLISHTDTTEVMIVEDHQISDEIGKESEIIITGSGFEAWFDNRIVGSNKGYPTNNGNKNYILASNKTWDQAMILLREHIEAAYLIDAADAVPYVTAVNQVPAGAGVTEQRNLQRGGLYSALVDLLKIDNLGIKIVRPGVWSPLGAASPNIAFVFHKGVDRTAEIVFSKDTGEIESSEYLFSIKDMKNVAMVSGKWVETIVTTAHSGYDRRVMYVDASDIDNEFAAAPTGTTFTSIVTAMQQRGLQALAAQTGVSLSRTEISKEAGKARYRTDFDVGDLITVVGDYGTSTKRRVTEYVEIEDENGANSYPTLSDEE